MTPTLTPPVLGNDDCTSSVELRQPTQDGAVATTGTQTNLGASDSSSVWFHTYAPVTAYTTYAIEDPDGGVLADGDRTLSVYRSPVTNTNVHQNSCPSNLTLLGEITGERPGFSFRTGEGNSNYWVKVSSSRAAESDFRLDLHFHRNEVVRDRYNAAEPIDVSANQTRIIDPWLQTNLWGTVEPGEDLGAGWSSAWYRLHNYWSAQMPIHTVEVIAPTNGMKPIVEHWVQVFEGGSSAANPGTLVASTTGNGTSSVTFTGPANGRHFYVRVASRSGHDSGAYRLRLTRRN